MTLSGTATSDNPLVATPTGSYQSIGETQVVATNRYGTDTTSSSSSRSKTGSSSRSGSVTSSASLTTSSTSRGSTSTITLLVGGGGLVTESIINGTVTLSSHLNTTTSATGTGSSTSTAALPTNTQPCNGYPEFCSRQYGNITEVCAHNSAFVQKGNAGANQALGITDQLDDGIRMIQGETHWVNNTIYSCHTTCDLLNSGTYLSELQTVAAWVETHPYDVVTILVVNSDYVDVGNYTGVFEASGLAPYLYEPPYIPMRLSQWPTLSEMILSQKRVVVFMDYQADQATVPYILDEFTHMWETPFSPTNRSFPCNTQRPPNLNQTVARDDLMYLANHNLNTEISLLGLDLLVPNTAELNVTNAAGDQYSMLGAMADNCTGKSSALKSTFSSHSLTCHLADWGRPPNFLLVDYYNNGDGSVFEVAAKHNNVTYTGKCCGVSSSGAADVKSSAIALVVALAAVFAFVV